MLPSASAFFDIIKHRRTHYLLGKESPIPDSEIEEIIKTCILHCPSTFNSQSTRVIVLFKAEHEKLWDLALDALKALIPAGQFATTKSRICGFRGGYGTVLFFEDQSVLDHLVVDMPQFENAFPQWVEHTAGLHHYAVWTALDAAGLGCNLQHYNPVIDAGVQDTWDVPKEWVLKAQLVFGAIINPPREKEFKPLEGRYSSFGARSLESHVA